MDTPAYRRRQSAAEVRRISAVRDATHALRWLREDKGEGEDVKPVGSVPWRYDLTEARGLLERAVRDINSALVLAVDPDTLTAAELMEQEG